MLEYKNYSLVSYIMINHTTFQLIICLQHINIICMNFFMQDKQSHYMLEFIFNISVMDFLKYVVTMKFVMFELQLIVVLHTFAETRKLFVMYFPADITFLLINNIYPMYYWHLAMYSFVTLITLPV